MPGQPVKHEFVEPVPQPEAKRFASFGAPRQDDVCGIDPAGLQQRGNVARAILAIAVHHENRVDVVAPRQLAETDSDRPLVPEIERQSQDLDPGDAAVGRQ